MSTIERSSKRANGMYYTPAAIARAIARWAIRGPEDRVFDPCYGGCAFLDAGMDVLADHGAVVPANYLWGVDADPAARAYLQRFIDHGAPPEHFLTTDFLTTHPGTLMGAPFDVVLANPPYVRHHFLSAEARRIRNELVRNAGANISKQASQWAYFIVHALQFIALGGRAAFVLPSALLTADYAAEVRHILVQRFRALTAVVVEDRLFPGTDEATVLVFCDGNDQGPAQVHVGMATRDDVLHFTTEDLPRLCRSLGDKEVDGRWLGAIVDPEALTLVDDLKIKRKTTELGQLASVSTGTVTGKNSFFIIRPSLQRDLKIPSEYLRPLITHIGQLLGLRLTAADVTRLAESDEQMLLINVPAGCHLPPGLKNYLAAGERDGVSSGYKCSRRRPWYSVPVTSPPDAFLPYMAGHAPRIIINDAAISCTNSLLRIHWTVAMSSEQIKALALSSLSTVTQLSAELVGRSYGGGVLKVEPSEAVHLVLPRLPVKEAAAAFDSAHQLLMGGEIEAARELVDTLCETHGILRPGENALLAAALSCSRQWRLGKHRRQSS